MFHCSLATEIVPTKLYCPNSSSLTETQWQMTGYTSGCRSEPFLISSAMRSAKNILTKDWYGTSRLFAISFNSSSIDSGNRNEIVFTDGFKLDNTTRLPFAQSTYSVELCDAQNSLSSSSVLKRGTFFFMTFGTPFFPFDSCPVPR